MVTLLLALSTATSPTLAQPGSGGFVIVEPPLAQGNSWFGAALLGGQRFATGTDELFVGEPLFDNGTMIDAGRWHRFTWTGRQASVANTLTGPWAGSQVGSTLALAFSTNSDGRLLSGDPGIPANNLPGAGRVGVVRNGWTLGPNLNPSSPVPLGVSEEDDEFGTAIAVGDFNGDGYEDIAVSAPQEDAVYTANSRAINSPEDVGAVYVYMGAASGNDFQWGYDLRPWGEHEDMAFGEALATGDFDGDGYDDLAVGAPGANSDGLSHAGAVYVYSGTPGGLETNSPQILEPSDFGVTAGVGLLLGDALAAGDFDRNILCSYYKTCRDDLAIGIPGYVDFVRRGTVQAEGAIVVAAGTASGLSGSNSTVIQQDDLVADLVFPPNHFDLFGRRLWAGNFDGRMGADLAIGVPNDGPGVSKAGVLHLVYGGSGGLQSHPGHLLHWGNTTGGPRESSDYFGAAFTSGDFDGDGKVDFAISAPSVTAAGVPDAGRIVVLFGGCLFCDGFEAGLTAWQ